MDSGPFDTPAIARTSLKEVAVSDGCADYSPNLASLVPYDVENTNPVEIHRFIELRGCTHKVRFQWHPLSSATYLLRRCFMGLDNDDRSGFRAPVAEHCEGTLRLCDAQIRVRVVNQSATGFKLSTDDSRLIPEMVDALLDMDDGVQHSVQIRNLKQDGDSQTLGVKRLETRVRLTSESQSAEKTRRMPVAKALVASAFVIALAFSLQAAPVRDRIVEISPFHFFAQHKSAKKSGAVVSARPPVPFLDRDRPFEFQRYLEADAADWLQLETTQRRVMRSLLDLCGGVRENRLTPAQSAMVDFATQASMLELLNDEQRIRLEGELQRPLSGSALLRDIIQRYSQHVSPQELYKQFGALLVVSPTIANQYGVSEEVVAAVCRQLDEAFAPSGKNEPLNQEIDAIDTKQIIVDFSRRLQQLEASCRTTALPTPTQLD